MGRGDVRVVCCGCGDMVGCCRGDAPVVCGCGDMTGRGDCEGCMPCCGDIGLADCGDMRCEANCGCLAWKCCGRDACVWPLCGCTIPACELVS